MNKAVHSVADLTPLNAPVPPMLATAIGYKGDAWFVSFHWTPAGDETYYSDGRISATGNWQAYLAYIRHPAISPLLKGYDLGSSDSEAAHALILDREHLALYVAPVKAAEKFLNEQWPKAPPLRISQKEFSALVLKALKNVKPPKDISVDEVYRRIREQNALVDELLLWLDKQLKN
jgi:hypothetical protein